MAEITVELIKTLRDKTNAGMMDCKAALQEADGDLEAAETVLRKKGIADADKKASRAATEGVIASRIVDDAKTGVIVEGGTDRVAAASYPRTASIDEGRPHLPLDARTRGRAARGKRTTPSSRGGASTASVQPDGSARNASER